MSEHDAILYCLAVARTNLSGPAAAYWAAIVAACERMLQTKEGS